MFIHTNYYFLNKNIKHKIFYKRLQNYLSVTISFVSNDVNKYFVIPFFSGQV